MDFQELRLDQVIKTKAQSCGSSLCMFPVYYRMGYQFL